MSRRFVAHLNIAMKNSYLLSMLITFGLVIVLSSCEKELDIIGEPDDAVSSVFRSDGSPEPWEIDDNYDGLPDVPRLYLAIPYPILTV